MAVLEVRQAGRVRWLRLDRPAKLNALNDEVYDALRAELTALADTPGTSVVVIAGNGRAFSAGADLTTGAMSADANADWAVQRHRSGRWQRLLDDLERLPQVTVASLHGHCVGGAALLAVACDLRIGADDLVVRIPELAIGIPLTWGGIPRLAREVGLPVARDLVMTGRSLDAHEALRVGFVQRVAPVGELAAATDALVGELLAMPAGPLAMTRAAFAAVTASHGAAGAWADADVLRWSRLEEESRTAGADYAQRRRS